MCSHDVRIWALFQMILDTLNKPRRFVFFGLHLKSCKADLAGLWLDHLMSETAVSVADTGTMGGAMKHLVKV